MTQQHTQRLDTQAPSDEQQPTGILSQVSMPTILAATLAAGTSFVFASKLGITGSLIGAVLGAAVSALASQVYNAMIKRSMERIEDLTEQVQAFADGLQGAEQTDTLDKTLIRQTPLGLQDDTGIMTDSYGTSVKARDMAGAHETATVVRRTFLVAAIAALLALAAYAAIVTTATQGQGIGPTTWEEVTSPAVSQDAASDEQVEATEEETPALDEEQATSTEQEATGKDEDAPQPEAEATDISAAETPSSDVSGDEQQAPTDETAAESPTAPTEEAPADTATLPEEAPESTTETPAA